MPHDTRRTATVFYLAVLTAVLSILPAPVCAGKLPGHIAFVRGGRAVLVPADGGVGRNLPESDGAVTVAVSPGDGSVVFFVAAKGSEDGRRGFLSRPPYQSSVSLPAPLDAARVYDVEWSGDGRTVWVDGEHVTGAYDVAARKWHPLPAAPESASRDGRVIAYTTDKDVRVRFRDTGRETTLFSIGRPERLLATVRRAKTGLKDLREGMSPTLWRNSTSWVFGAPALAPDGKSLYFIANAGTGQGASGNTTFAWFCADLATGAVTPLEKAGTFFGRLPGLSAVSPDGKRLLFASSSHSSAIENPYEVWLIDLATAGRRRLVSLSTGGRMNLVGGGCWSPDGRFVAVNVLYYRTADVMKEPDWQPREQDYTLEIYDAATGKRVRAMPGGGPPTWTRK